MVCLFSLRLLDGLTDFLPPFKNMHVMLIRNFELSVGVYECQCCRDELATYPGVSTCLMTAGGGSSRPLGTLSSGSSGFCKWMDVFPFDFVTLDFSVMIDFYWKEHISSKLRPKQDGLLKN